MDSHHDEASVALPDSVAHLGRLEPGSIIDKAGLATLFHRCERSIDRAIERGELPPPTRLLGSLRWTVGSIIGHIEHRLQTAAKEREALDRRLQDFNL